jgi:hypothetical protein
MTPRTAAITATEMLATRDGEALATTGSAGTEPG